MASDEIAAAFVACKHWRWIKGIPISNAPNFARGDMYASGSDVGTGWLPDVTHAFTLGHVEHDLLPNAWAHAGDRVAIEVVHDHVVDARAGTLSASIRCRVLVWTPGSWREHWSSPACSTKAEALLRCLEAA